jgi:hypothetical protein
VGILIRTATVAMFLAMSACAYPRPAVLRVEAAAGATFVIAAGTFREERSIPSPFQASFGAGGESAPYEIEIRMPPDVARRYGASDAVTLHATLYVFRGGGPVRGVRVPLDDGELHSLITGERHSVQVVVRSRDGAETPIARMVIRAADHGSPGDAAPVSEQSEGRELGSAEVAPSRF